MRNLFIPILAIVTGISSTAVIVHADTTLQGTLHASAFEDMQSRVEARRLLRQNSSAGQSISELRELRQNRVLRPTTSKQSSSRRSYIRRTRPTFSRSSSSARTSSSVPSSLSDLMDRRNARRERRLGNLPSPIKFQVIEGVNMERAKMALAPLRAQIDLETAAQKHAQDMLNRNYFSHENPDGLRSNDRIKATGYGVVNAQECRCSYKVYLGENLAKGQTTVEQVIEEWMESPSHRDAMLSKDYDEIGVGIVDDIWVLNFGKIEITVGR